MAAVQSQVNVDFTPISPTFGAEILGIDGTEPLEPEMVARLKALLMQYKVIFFRDQHLDYAQQAAFASHFGEPRVDPLEACVAGYPGLALLDNVPFFHADWMNAEDPPLWSILQLTTVPSVGGDTMFADLVGSYRTLSAPLRGFLETCDVLQSIHSYEGDGSTLARSFHNRYGGDYEDIFRRVQPRTQPLVRSIPETGEANYWLSRSYTRRIEGLTESESRALLELLFNHQLQPEYVIRWRWHAGDLAFWDHRTTLHSGVKDYGDFERHGARVSLAGGRLIPARGEDRSSL